jgi:hypothetical protein
MQKYETDMEKYKKLVNFEMKTLKEVYYEGFKLDERFGMRCSCIPPERMY